MGGEGGCKIDETGIARLQIIYKFKAQAKRELPYRDGQLVCEKLEPECSCVNTSNMPKIKHRIVAISNTYMYSMSIYECQVHTLCGYVIAWWEVWLK